MNVQIQMQIEKEKIHHHTILYYTESTLWPSIPSIIFIAARKDALFICEVASSAKIEAVQKDASNHSKADLPIDRDSLANHFNPIQVTTMMPPLQSEGSLCLFADLVISTMGGC